MGGRPVASTRLIRFDFPAGSADPPARPVHARVDQAGQAARAVEGEPPLCAPNPATPARSAPLRRSPAPSPSATRAPRRAGAAACRVSTESRPRPRPVLALWESSGVRGGERGDAPGPGHEGDMPLLKPGVSCLDSMEHGFESMLQCVWLQPCRRARCSGPHASASHPPLVLPLRHFLCVPCARRLKGDGQTKCPICNRTVLMWAVQKR